MMHTSTPDALPSTHYSTRKGRACKEAGRPKTLLCEHCEEVAETGQDAAINWCTCGTRTTQV
jgi:hypothetical protein